MTFGLKKGSHFCLRVVVTVVDVADVVTVLVVQITVIIDWRGVKKIFDLLAKRGNLACVLIFRVSDGDQLFQGKSDFDIVVVEHLDVTVKAFVPGKLKIIL
tara:strand:- start:5977 stop:6279 length:303 start_codon:yes stop_codon:yes gene_type:complete